MPINWTPPTRLENSAPLGRDNEHSKAGDQHVRPARRVYSCVQPAGHCTYEPGKRADIRGADPILSTEIASIERLHPPTRRVRGLVSSVDIRTMLSNSGPLRLVMVVEHSPIGVTGSPGKQKHRLPSRQAQRQVARRALAHAPTALDVGTREECEVHRPMSHRRSTATVDYGARGIDRRKPQAPSAWAVPRDSHGIRAH